MPDEIIIRPAKKSDAAELAILVDVSSHGFASWFWYGAVLDGSKETAFEQGRSFMRSDTERASWKDSSVAVAGEEIAGVIIGHPIEPSIANEVAPHAAIEPILALQKMLVDHWFIDSLGVYRHLRGKGLGKRLLLHEVERGAGRPISLITESHNETALGLYKSHGFAEVTRRQAVPLSDDSKEHDWVLLTRGAA
ncbi:N-acetyltransferase [Mesorhizobium sp. 1M-11]|uniref:GNAT family N-acetyltransferase n=1 Tax=Mesorhizobium sp. 1M-11 TaxID=1529006 RepID=UPI0006C73F96|nr:N-acetyltransferase [Mesorhizobium sp. 1M-11]